MYFSDSFHRAYFCQDVDTTACTWLENWFIFNYMITLLTWPDTQFDNIIYLPVMLTPSLPSLPGEPGGPGGPWGQRADSSKSILTDINCSQLIKC